MRERIRLDPAACRELVASKWTLIPQESGCLWLPYKPQPTGYIRVTMVIGEERKGPLAHRVAWVASNGRDIAEGMDIDHLCHTNDPLCLGGATCLHRRCVNVEHMEEVAPVLNVRRGQSFAGEQSRRTHCPKGHPLEDGNLAASSLTYGVRRCLTCTRERSRGDRIRKHDSAPIIREWAVAQGIPISRTARIPQAVRAAWQEAGSPA